MPFRPQYLADEQVPSHRAAADASNQSAIMSSVLDIMCR